MKHSTQAFSKNCLPASLFKKGLSENVKKGLIENGVTFEFEALSPNPIDVINRRNGFSKPFQKRLERKPLVTA